MAFVICKRRLSFVFQLITILSFNF